jgi:membrane-associated phospholipid phosphatase
MGPILDFGVRFIALFQSLGTWLETPMKLFSFLGTEDFFMVALPIIYWCYDTTLGMQVAFILMFSNSVNCFFKVAFHGPRPYWYSPLIKGLASETSFGVPSNHMQSATVLWGIMAAWLRKPWAWITAVALTLLIGLSRLYLGVHFPHDILIGFLLGVVLVWVVVRYWKPVTKWLAALTLRQQILTAFLVSLGLVLFTIIPVVWLNAIHWQPPQEWAAYAALAVSYQDIFTFGGTLFGLLAGYAWLQKQGCFDAHGTGGQLVLRFLIGVAGVLAIRYGLKAIFPEGETLAASIFRFVRYTLIGFWVTGGAPWCFIRLKLAEKAPLENITVSLLNDSGMGEADI